MNAVFENTLILANWFTEFEPEHRFVLVLVLIGCATAVLCTAIGVISTTANAVHRRRVEAELKTEMLDRGMSAEEIATVTEAASPPEDATGRWIASWAKKPKQV